MYRTPGGARALLGVEPITSKPYHPTTQGKNERFHQTLFRYLDQQPLAASIAELQEQVDRFDLIYNTQRPHQGLPGRITPQQAWDATEVAQAPRPDRDTAPITPGGSAPQQHTTARHRVRRHKPIGAAGQRELTVGRTAPSTSVASRSWSTATWPPPRSSRSGTPAPSPSPTPTARS